ncbi:MAG: peptide ABC transporter substrate-binding protein [Myxococcales bacterium]|nr:peptide ABC transporter substrate-binding protein [Myxococcales bacterium]
MRARAPAALATLALAGCLVVGCPAGKPDAAADAKTLRLNLGTEPETLDWTRGRDSVSFDVVGCLMDGLTRLDAGGRVEPALAEGWEFDDAGRRLTFHLRPGVRWTDGHPLEADQFVAAWRRLLDPTTAAEYAYVLYPIAGARAFNEGKTRDPATVGVEAPDARTLVVRFEKPATYFPGLTTFMVTFPIPTWALRAGGDRWTEPDRIVTLGPFRLARWRHDDRIDLVAWDGYWDGRRALDRVEMVMVEEASTAVLLYESGALDFLDSRSLPPALIPRYSKAPGHASAPQLRSNYLGFNTAKPPFNDRRARAAFAMALDRSVIPRVLRGGEIPLRSFLPPGLLGYDPAVGLPFDPERARALLAEAGWPGGRGFPPVELAYNTREDHKTLAEAVQAMWKRELGVEVVLRNEEWKVFLQSLVVDPPAIYRLGWGADYPDPHNFMELFTRASGNNHTRWGSAEYDALIDRAAATAAPADRVALYTRAQRILLEEAVAIVPTHAGVMHYVTRPWVHGLAPNPQGVLDLRAVALDPAGARR